MSIQVYKFGGASIASPEKMKNLLPILQAQPADKLVLVVSAIGKMTNALEKVVHAHVNKNEKAFQYLQEVQQFHFRYCDELFTHPELVKDEIANHFVEVHWMIEEEVKDDYDYCYDQIVSVGELASTAIFTHFLRENNIAGKWVDARGVIYTDNTFREAVINWQQTKQAVENKILPYLEDNIVITQGFIGSTSDNETTTLGREGSDYSGAIIASCLQAESLTIWKDVSGVLNADPRKIDDTVKLPFLTYREAVEMTYYGAKVIHPKTIKPLQNSDIPLIVRPFTAIEESGTIIKNNGENDIPKAIYIEKPNQALVQVYAKDFSFFNEELVSTIMKAFHQHHITINLMQRGAIQCSFVIDYHQEELEELEKQLANQFLFETTLNLRLQTLRHFKENDIESLQSKNEVILEQRSPITYQMVSKQ